MKKLLYFFNNHYEIIAGCVLFLLFAITTLAMSSEINSLRTKNTKLELTIAQYKQAIEDRDIVLKYLAKMIKEEQLAK